MIEIKNRDMLQEKHKKKYEVHQLKSKKAAVFGKLLLSALNSVMAPQYGVKSSGSG